MAGSPEPAAAVPPAPEFFSVGRGTAILVVGTFVLFLASFLSRVLIAQSYSLDDWGSFSLALALTGLLSLVGLAGLDQAAARSLSYERDPATRRTIVRYTLAVSAASAVISSLLVFLAAPVLGAAFHASVLVGVFQLFAITVGFGLLSLMLAALFQGFEDAAPNALFNQILNPVLFVVAVAAAVVWHLGFEWVLVGYVVADGIALAALIGYALLRLPSYLPSAVSSAPVPNLWTLAVSFWGVGSLSFVTAFLDTLILGLFRPAGDVGLYAAGMVLARVILVGNGALTYIYLPVASGLARSRRMDLLRATYVAGTRWSLLIVTPFFVVFTFLPGAALAAVFGPSYLAGATPLRILAVAAFASVVVGPVNACLAGLGEVRTLLGTTALSAGTNLVLSFALIPVYGAVGAAVAWGVARVVYPGAGLLALHRRHRVSSGHPSLTRPTLLTLGLVIPLFLALGALSLTAWVVVPAGLAVFGITVLSMLATRSILPGDHAIARMAERAVRRPLPRLRRLLASAAYVPESPLGPTIAEAP